MRDLQLRDGTSNGDGKDASGVGSVHLASHDASDLSTTPSRDELVESGEDQVLYRVYKRRFFGLFQLVLLNIIVSWNVRVSWRPGTVLTILYSG